MGLLRSLGEQIEMQSIITVFKEGAFTPIATLGDVMRDAGKDESEKSSYPRCLVLQRQGFS